MGDLQIWPVIHIDTQEQVLRNAARAERAGCAGVLLIHMDGQDHLIDPMAEQVRIRHPRLSLGVNYLSMGAMEGLKRSLACGWDASWSDNPGVRSDGVSEEARNLGSLLAGHKDHVYFGSIAFKYQPNDPLPALAACRALELGMIPTTSGRATGSPPTKEKLSSIREAIGQAPLAVASGITPANLPEIGSYLTHVLVSTGIGSDFHEIDPDKLDQLMVISKSRSGAG